MKIIELNSNPPSLDEIVKAAREEDILLVRDGRALVRLERFDDEDWEDWKYESSSAGLERGRRAREQFARGEYKTLEKIKKEFGMHGGAQGPQ